VGALPEQLLPAEQVVEASEAGEQEQQSQDQPLNNVQQVTGDTEPTSTLVIPEQATAEQQIETNVTTTAEITTTPATNSQQQAPSKDKLQQLRRQANSDRAMPQRKPPNQRTLLQRRLLRASSPKA